MAITFNSIPTKRLATTIDGSAVLLKVNNILDWSGTTDLTSAYLGDLLYAVLRDADNTVIEIMQLDPTTIANNSTTGITILRRGLKYNGDLTTEVTANKLVWVKNQTIVELGSDVPQIFANMVNLTDAQTIAGQKIFSALPQTTAGNPVVANDLARKAYVDTVVAGIATSVSEVVPGTAGETLVAGNLIYLKTSDSRWWKTDADTASTVENVLLGIAQGAGTAGVAITNGIMVRGVDTNQSGLVAGTVMYASNTAGGISTTAGTTEVTVGVAKSATELYFDPRFNQQITEDQQDALAGNGGTPSASNRYVTETGFTSAVSTALGYYGNGADGAAVLDGSNTFAWASKVGSTYTMTANVMLTNLTINSGVILETAGYIIVGNGTLSNSGTIQNNGGAGGNGTAGANGSSGGTGGAAGTAAPGASLTAGTAGQVGGHGADWNGANVSAGVNGTAKTSVGSNGVAGGTGGGAANGSTGGTNTAETLQVLSSLFYPVNITAGVTTTLYNKAYATTSTNLLSLSTSPGSGSGGGGTSGTNSSAGGGGGGSGGTGGAICIIFKTITNAASGIIRCNGGAGGAGGNSSNAGTSGGGGGGGGGNGGTIVLVYTTLTDSGTIQCSGGAVGAAGSATGGGTNGTAGTIGTAGKIFKVVIS